jgi:hypothetical protein
MADIINRGVPRALQNTSSSVVVSGDREADHAVGKVRRRVRHAPAAARRTKGSPLTRKGDQLVLTTCLTDQSQEAMGWNTAFEELTELPLDEAGNVPVLLPFARKKRLQIFGHHLVKHSLLGLPGTIRLSAIEPTL